MGLQHSGEPATRDAANFEQNLKAFFGSNIDIKSYGHHVKMRHDIREIKTALNSGWSEFQMVTKVEDALYELDNLDLLFEYQNGLKERLPEGKFGLVESLNKNWVQAQRAAKLAAVAAGKSHHLTVLPDLGSVRPFLKNVYGIEVAQESKLVVRAATFDAGPHKGVSAVMPFGSGNSGRKNAAMDGVTVVTDRIWDSV